MLLVTVILSFFTRFDLSRPPRVDIDERCKGATGDKEAFAAEGDGGLMKDDIPGSKIGGCSKTRLVSRDDDTDERCNRAIGDTEEVLVAAAGAGAGDDG